ncbi:DUF6596 domain-containing protein [Nitratireductor basaltis]|uniref:Putative RNA polymerase, sigma-24 subunit, ECF subfamily protein n=1 Tax=Nitratireductor basaltis TaxID=472175 RepID=A0A084U522_9HYPH|nr:DUF6596 domain-containing protein [Nitratireductor basaltis]KFB08058.1 putative RNA polymerase, sigma-24 subunit, ECF subfamily protein [Nitratireductor basaltis]
MVFTVTPIYALCVSVIYLILWFRVTAMRGGAGISIGDGENRDLLLRVRQHGNCAEWSTFILILMLLAEGMETPDLYLHLTGALQELHSADAEIEGALALMLFTHARRKARINKAGASVPIGEQDRKLWQIAEIEEGERLLTRALQANAIGPFQLKAAIAGAQMQESGADWKQIALLYRQLWQHEPTPVIMLNWCVAVAECGQVEEALQRLEMLHQPLAAFQPFHAARAEFLARLNRKQEARRAYEAAMKSAPHEASRRFLKKRMAQLEPL